MKKIFIFIFGILILGGFVSANWYNPFSWFNEEKDITGFATSSCLDGQRQCVGNSFQMCDINGIWNQMEYCSSGSCITDVSNGIIGCDLDGDGYVNDVYGGTDCNDGNANVNLGKSEICNDGVDNNCNGLIDCADSSCVTSAFCSGEQIIVLIMIMMVIMLFLQIVLLEMIVMITMQM
jgi:hypothetical protein